MREKNRQGERKFGGMMERVKMQEMKEGREICGKKAKSATTVKQKHMRTHTNPVGRSVV